MSSTTTVTVFLDGKPLVVPEVVDCHYGARGALGIPRGMGVAYEFNQDELLVFKNGHRFVNGDRYVTRDASALLSRPEDDELEPWQIDPEAWKRAG